MTASVYKYQNERKKNVKITIANKSSDRRKKNVHQNCSSIFIYLKLLLSQSNVNSKNNYFIIIVTYLEDGIFGKCDDHPKEIKIYCKREHLSIINIYRHTRMSEA